MKAKDVLKITGITRNHLDRLVKQDKIKAHRSEAKVFATRKLLPRKPNGQYDYNSEDVYKYVGKKRRNLNIIFIKT